MASELTLARKQLRQECYSLLEHVFENRMYDIDLVCASIIRLASHIKQLEQRERRMS